MSKTKSQPSSFYRNYMECEFVVLIGTYHFGNIRAVPYGFIGNSSCFIPITQTDVDMLKEQHRMEDWRIIGFIKASYA